QPDQLRLHLPGRRDQRVDRRGQARLVVAPSQELAQRPHRRLPDRAEGGDHRAPHRPARIRELGEERLHPLLAERDELVDGGHAGALFGGEGRVGTSGHQCSISGRRAAPPTISLRAAAMVTIVSASCPLAWRISLTLEATPATSLASSAALRICWAMVMAISRARVRMSWAARAISWIAAVCWATESFTVRIARLCRSAVLLSWARPPACSATARAVWRATRRTSSASLLSAPIALPCSPVA